MYRNFYHKNRQAIKISRFKREGMFRTLMPQRLGGALKMEDKKATIMDNVCPDLQVPPHIVGKLFHLVAGEWQPDPSQQEQLIVHLTECSYCRTSLIVLLSADQEYVRLNSYHEAPARNLLSHDHFNSQFR
jgi:hypothetical protein